MMKPNSRSKFYFANNALKRTYDKVEFETLLIFRYPIKGKGREVGKGRVGLREEREGMKEGEENKGIAWGKIALWICLWLKEEGS